MTEIVEAAVAGSVEQRDRWPEMHCSCPSRIIAAAAVAAALVFIPTASWSQPAPLVLCGPGGPPPGQAPSERDIQLDAQRQSLGHVLVCPENLSRFDYAASAQPLAGVLPRLSFRPTELARTAFSWLEPIGAAGDYWSGDGKAAGLHRTFRTPSGIVIDLLEWDMGTSGSVSIAPERLTERVKGFPAQLLILKSTSGPAVSLLQWVAARRYYELTISIVIRLLTTTPTLWELAESVPAPGR